MFSKRVIFFNLEIKMLQKRKFEKRWTKLNIWDSPLVIDFARFFIRLSAVVG